MTGETAISLPDEHTPENSALYAVNQLRMPAAPEAIWAWLCRPDLWPTFYSNAKLIKHLDGWGGGVGGVTDLGGNAMGGGVIGEFVVRSRIGL